MQLDWIDDILAVIDEGSLAQAAERRFITQSAFTRRVRMIEEKIGTTLFDRSRKPVATMPGVLALEPELRDLSARLRRLGSDLCMSADGRGGGVTFICQHAIATTISPRIVQMLTALEETSVRVRSGNRDECLMLVLSGNADFAVTYESLDERKPLLPRGFEKVSLGVDRLVPVCAPSLVNRPDQATIPIISYPRDVFFGEVFHQHIEPRLKSSLRVLPKAETALTLAACELAMEAIGIAWLPLTLVSKHLADGHLCHIDELPAQPLTISMVRLAGPQTARQDCVWEQLMTQLDFPMNL